MVTLTINGQVLQVEKGATILEAAAQADIHIPPPVLSERAQ